MYGKDNTEQRRQSDTEKDNEESSGDQDRETQTESLMNSRWFTVEIEPV
jgi:hypothetical protein